MDIFKPPATTPSHVNSAQAFCFPIMPRDLFLQDVQEKFVATAVPEMLALHLDEHIEACLIVLVMSMMGTAARYKNTLLLDELRLMSHDLRIPYNQHSCSSSGLTSFHQRLLICPRPSPAGDLNTRQLDDPPSIQYMAIRYFEWVAAEGFKLWKIEFCHQVDDRCLSASGVPDKSYCTPRVYDKRNFMKHRFLRFIAEHDSAKLARQHSGVLRVSFQAVRLPACRRSLRGEPHRYAPCLA